MKISISHQGRAVGIYIGSGSKQALSFEQEHQKLGTWLEEKLREVQKESWAPKSCLWVL